MKKKRCVQINCLIIYAFAASVLRVLEKSRSFFEKYKFIKCKKKSGKFKVCLKNYKFYPYIFGVLPFIKESFCFFEHCIINFLPFKVYFVLKIQFN